MSLRNRLLAVERACAPKDELQIVVLQGGLSDAEPTTARAGELTWERFPEETLEGFQARVVGEARGAQEKLLVIGGLPGTGAASGGEPSPLG